ncbi:hypothetical protein Pyn_10275 [Prunus yedoensis var. nudiflora]|uniref:Uncharacterized protein n=1 Tax=Prunus yedoensis var. nudiflora TaxID=2094558 RepID=A0A314UB03_PRUYE|nr:hypothetical protein Pyn_10275 [Prunus yedoensis var. nudiflora]
MSMMVVPTSCKADVRVVGDKVALQAASGVVSTTLQLDNMEETLKFKRSNKVENNPALVVVTEAVVVFVAPHLSTTIASV